MKLFGHNGKWYLTKFAKFRYRESRGDGLAIFFIGKIKSLLLVIVTLGTGEIVGQAWWQISILSHVSWKVVLLVPIGLIIMDYLLGWADEKFLHLMQMEAEIKLRRKLSPWESEKMERLRNIEKKIAPETYKEEHKTYLVGDKSKLEEAEERKEIDRDKKINQ